MIPQKRIFPSFFLNVNLFSRRLRDRFLSAFQWPDKQENVYNKLSDFQSNFEGFCGDLTVNQKFCQQNPSGHILSPNGVVCCIKLENRLARLGCSRADNMREKTKPAHKREACNSIVLRRLIHWSDFCNAAQPRAGINWAKHGLDQSRSPQWVDHRKSASLI